MSPLDALVSNASTQLATNASRSKPVSTRTQSVSRPATGSSSRSTASPAAEKYDSAKEAAIPTAKPATPARTTPLTINDLISNANLTRAEQRAIDLAKKAKTHGLTPENKALLDSANAKILNSMTEDYGTPRRGKGGGGGGRGGGGKQKKKYNPIVATTKSGEKYKPIMGFDDLKKHPGSKPSKSPSKEVSDFLKGPPLYASPATRNPPKPPPGPRKQVHAFGNKNAPLGNAYGSDEHGNARFYGSGPGGGRTHNEMLAAAGSAAASQTGGRL